MALHPHVFNETYVTIIRYGEIFGEVDLVLERYVEHPEEMFKPCRPKPT
jgi:type II secretory pathway component PulF